MQIIQQIQQKLNELKLEVISIQDNITQCKFKDKQEMDNLTFRRENILSVIKILEELIRGTNE